MSKIKQKRKGFQKFPLTIILLGPILWVIFAKILKISYDKLFLCSLLSILCSFILCFLWIADFYEKVLLDYDDEIIKLQEELLKKDKENLG
ncbi:hypothetical protein [Pseudolactococcus laudensis]|uniref:hypothetical protein n=1 Tax=Pseudolactococcus laudensis TaxID=1494461 RepID=UPI00058B56EF